MKNIKSKILLSIAGILSICCVLVYCFCSSAMMSANAQLLGSAGTKSQHISYTITNYSDEETPAAQSENIKLTLKGDTTEEYEKVSYDWKNTKIIEFAMDTTSISTEGRESYTVSYTLTWAPTLIANEEANFDVQYADTKELIASKEYATREEIPTNFKIYLDETLPTEANSFSVPRLFDETYASVGGCWGMYLFTFSLGGTDLTESSAVIEIRPTNVATLTKANVKTEKLTGSKTGMRYYYEFTIDSDEYNFVDKMQIKWFVSGKSTDGKSFVLEEGDEEGSNFIYPSGSINRNGKTFTFDPPYEGTWNVSYKIYQSDRSTEVADLASAAEEVSTAKGLTTEAIIWIVVGAAAAAGIIVAIVIIVSIKREKVY